MAESVRIVLAADHVAVGAGGDHAGWIETGAIETLDAGRWQLLRAHVGAEAVVILAPGDFHEVMVAADTHAVVARRLAAVSPLASSRIRWGWVPDVGGARVAMAHRDRVDAVVSLFAGHGIAVTVTAGGIALPVRTGPAISPLWALAAIPLLTAVGAWGLAAAGEARIASLRPVAAQRAHQVAQAAARAAAFGHAGVDETLGALAKALPRDATVHAVGRGADGTLSVAVDGADPERLRVAIARVPVLAGLRTTGQIRVPDRGIRIELRSTGW